MKKRRLLIIPLVGLLGAGLFALTRPVPVAHAAPPLSHTIIRTSGSEADAGFSLTQGDVTDFAVVVVSPKGFPAPTPISGPAVVVSVGECIQTGENAECTNFMGIVPAPGLQFDTNKLTSATLPEMTVPVTPVDENGNPSGGPPSFDVTVALTWTGVGSITSSHSVSHFRVGHEFSEMTRFKGTFRNATISGTISYPAPLLGPITLTGANSEFAGMMSQGSMDISIQR